MVLYVESIHPMKGAAIYKTSLRHGIQIILLLVGFNILLNDMSTISLAPAIYEM